MNNRTLRHLPHIAAVAALAGAFAPSLGMAQTIPFPVAPLYLTSSVEPNVIVAIDNSGSTDWEIAFNSSDGRGWWNTSSFNPAGGGTCAVGFAGCAAASNGTSDYQSSPTTDNLPNFNTTYNSSQTTTQFAPYDYVFPNGPYGTSNSGGRLYKTSNSTDFAAPPLTAYAFMRDWEYNGMYFNPNQLYTHWSNDGALVNGQPKYQDASWTAAQFDPNPPSGYSSQSLDLTSYVFSSGSVAALNGSGQSIPLSSVCSGITPSGTTSAQSDWGFHVFGFTSNSVFYGMTIPKGTCILIQTQNTNKWVLLANDVRVGTSDLAVSTDNLSKIGNNTDVYIAYFPATFYVSHGTSLSALGYKSPTLTGYAPDGKTQLDGYEIKPENFTSTAAYQTALQNFANWFQYYRKRYMAIRAGMGAAFHPITGMRIASFSIDNSSGNAWSSNLNILDLGDPTNGTTNKQTLYDTYFYGYPRGQFGTPNRQAIQFMGNQLRRTDSAAPIQYSCQQNFTMLFTDGYADSYTLTVPSTGAVNGSNFDGQSIFKPPYSDNTSGTMADEAMYDYGYNPSNTSSDAWALIPNGTTMPSTGAQITKGQVPVPPACNASNHSPALDCNTNLHADFYGIMLNNTGFKFGVDTAATSDPYSNITSSSYWPPSSQLSIYHNPSNLDDLWHATINAHGLMFNARNTTEIVNDIQSVLLDIISKVSSASAVAVNSSNLTASSQAFQARFNTTDWSGQLLDYPVSTGTATSGPCTGLPIGTLCSLQWDAGQVINSQSPSSRIILTYDPDHHQAIPFTWTGYVANSPTLSALLNINPDSLTNDSNGSLRLSWLRGDHTQEQVGSSPLFRSRPSSVLGDIIDSNPNYVGAPSFAYGFDNYATFRQQYYSRTPVVYVGSNDGMLHGFKATNNNDGTDGTELLAFVPSKAYGTVNGSTVTPKLGDLTSINYSHAYSVDGSPSVGDAEIGGNWKTVLVEDMGYGGQEVFALNVTDPSTFPTSAASASAAASIAMWEFTDADDPDMGYSFSEPVIVKMNNGRWAALIGNGYNNTDADGHASSTGHAALFILFLDHTGSTWTAGQDYIKLSLTNDGASVSSPNGLATPAAVDTTGDGKVDRIYAGDLRGNLWRFDVSSSSATNWTVAYGGKPLFQATDSTGKAQPITSAPDLGINTTLTNSTTTVLNIYFGTGRYLSTADNASSGQVTQTFYGIFDKDYSSVPLTRANSSTTLVAQTILSQVNSTGGTCSSGSSCYRTVSSNPVDATQKSGWYMDLIVSGSTSNNGERVVHDPILQSGRIIFSTLIPQPIPCQYGGTGWLMELNSQTGGLLTTPLFDINGDGKIDSSDTINGSNVAGLQSTVGIISSPTILSNESPNGPGGPGVKLLSGTTGQVQTPIESQAITPGRISWRELFQ